MDCYTLTFRLDGCTRLDLYSHKTHCVISNPYDRPDISCSVETLIFRLAIYTPIEKRPTYRLASSSSSSSSVRFPRPFVFLEYKVLRETSCGITMRPGIRTRRRPNIPHPPVCVWTTRPGCISYKA